jgi:hypothetical protein
MNALPDEAADLFRVPPERFIAKRDVVVKGLREAGRDDEAAAVKALRKPTTVVWGLNQLAEREPAALALLFEAGRELRSAQRAALAGEGADALREATDARRAAIGRLATATIAILDDAGLRSVGQTDPITVALEAASIDPESGSGLAAGRLERMPAAPAGLGFGDLPVLTALEGGAGKPRKGKARPEPRADDALLRRERDDARKTARTRRAMADRLAHEIEELRERLTTLETKHAEADARALESELEAERATKLLDG